MQSLHHSSCSTIFIGIGAYWNRGPYWNKGTYWNGGAYWNRGTYWSRGAYWNRSTYWNDSAYSIGALIRNRGASRGSVYLKGVLIGGRALNQFITLCKHLLSLFDESYFSISLTAGIRQPRSNQISLITVGHLNWNFVRLKIRQHVSKKQNYKEIFKFK